MSENSAQKVAPLTMTSEQWLGALADAWDAGFRQGESFASWGTDKTANPYRVTPPDSTAAPR